MKNADFLKCIFVIAIVCDTTSAQETPPATLQQIRSNYSDAVNQLRTHFAAMKGTARYSEEVSWNNNPHGLSFHVEFARDGDVFKVITTDCNGSTPNGKVNKPPDSVSCSNDEMSFRLEKQAGARSFIIAQTEESGKKLSTGAVTVLPMLECAYNPHGFSMSNLLADPNFQLRKVENHEFHNMTMIKMYFHFNRKPPGQRQPKALSDLWILVSP
jgi:hypothetical protein